MLWDKPHQRSKSRTPTDRTATAVGSFPQELDGSHTGWRLTWPRLVEWLHLTLLTLLCWSPYTWEWEWPGLGLLASVTSVSSLVWAGLEVLSLSALRLRGHLTLGRCCGDLTGELGALWLFTPRPGGNSRARPESEEMSTIMQSSFSSFSSSVS